MVNNPTYKRQPSFKTPDRRMILWTVLMVGLGILATVLVITASANPPSAADIRINGLVNELRQDRLTAQRHDAQRELEAAGEAAVPALTVALRSSDVTMRRNAADVLGFIASASSIGVLQESLANDTVPNVRRNAAWALGNISSLETLNALERASVMDKSELVRVTALDSIARVQSRLALSIGIDERELTAYAVSPQNPNLVYATTSRDLFTTQNGGATWAKLANALPSMTNVLAVSPADHKTIYAGIDGLGMFKSKDGGRTWLPINKGLDVTPGARYLVTDVTIDPLDPEHLVIATGVMLGTSNVDFYATGFRVSTDGGLTWNSMNGNTPDEPLTQLAIEGDRLYALAGAQVLVYRMN